MVLDCGVFYSLVLSLQLYRHHHATIIVRVGETPRHCKYSRMMMLFVNHNPSNIRCQKVTASVHTVIQ
jgi:hypothetical protein